MRITHIEQTLTCIANQSLQSNYVFSERCLRPRCPMQCDASPASGHQASPVHIHTLPQLCEGRPLSKAHTQKHARAFREQCSRSSRAMSRQRPRMRRILWRRLQAGLLENRLFRFRLHKNLDDSVRVHVSCVDYDGHLDRQLLGGYLDVMINMLNFAVCNPCVGGGVAFNSDAKL